MFPTHELGRDERCRFHPSGDPTPSPEDARVTADVRRAGEQLDVELLDHVIVARSGCVSLKQRRLGFA